MRIPERAVHLGLSAAVLIAPLSPLLSDETNERPVVTSLAREILPPGSGFTLRHIPADKKEETGLYIRSQVAAIKDRLEKEGRARIANMKCGIYQHTDPKLGAGIMLVHNPILFVSGIDEEPRDMADDHGGIMHLTFGKAGDAPGLSGLEVNALVYEEGHSLATAPARFLSGAPLGKEILDIEIGTRKQGSAWQFFNKEDGTKVMERQFLIGATVAEGVSRCLQLVPGASIIHR